MGQATKLGSISTQCSDNQNADDREQKDKPKPVQVAPRGKYLSPYGSSFPLALRC
jgi:hypothetical protein